MSKHVITLGEIMMRLSTSGFNRFSQAESFRVTFGGAEANVGISLAKWGVAASHVTRLPDHDLGKSVVDYLNRHKVGTSFIRFGKERLGVYFLENGAMHRAPKIIYDRFDSAFANIRPGEVDWQTVMQNASWFHWTGITPAISHGAADVCLEAILAANKYGVPVSGDINYRRNLWQYGKNAIDIMPGLIQGTQYMIAGLTDIENCLGITSNDFNDACSQVKSTYPEIKKIANTNRETISASHNKIQGILWDGQKQLHSREYDLTHIVDRVGADQHTIEFAAAASALKHSIEGDANLATVDEVEALVRNENTGKLLR
jgi:2-dehydro-3-deoxygluconokinase